MRPEDAHTSASLAAPRSEVVTPVARVNPRLRTLTPFRSEVPMSLEDSRFR
jgi:hypothetical protein